MRLIDADALIKNWERDRGRMFDADYFIFTIEHVPTIDAVPVVRCKDCVNCEKDTMFCTVFDKNRLENDFCSEGEK